MMLLARGVSPHSFSARKTQTSLYAAGDKVPFWTHRLRGPALAVAAQQRPLQQAFDQTTWEAGTQDLYHALRLPPSTTPLQLWEKLSSTPQDALQAQLPKLDLPTCRLLLIAAAATCTTQQQHNLLAPLFRAAVPVFPTFELNDFRQLLQLCAQARHVPDHGWLANVYYADTGGIERLYKQEPPEALVLLLCDLSAALGSIQQLLEDTRQATALLQQQQQQQEEGLNSSFTGSSGSKSSSKSAAAAAAAAAAGDSAGGQEALAAEVSALQAALQQSSANLMSIQQDPLLAGELSAVGGYWLLRRFLPAVVDQPELVLQGLCALPGLGYKVLDANDSDVLLGQLTPQLQCWSPSQLAAAVTSTLPCLGDIPPADGQQLAVLFAAVGAAARLVTPQEAGEVLLVLAQLPGYAPDAMVAQSLLDTALQPPLQNMTARQLYQLLQAAAELGAAPNAQQLQLVQTFLQP